MSTTKTQELLEEIVRITHTPPTPVNMKANGLAVQAIASLEQPCQRDEIIEDMPEECELPSVLRICGATNDLVPKPVLDKAADRIEDLEGAVTAMLKQGQEQPCRKNFVLEMPNIDCPKCKRKQSMEWDGRAKIYICLYTVCKHVVRITCEDCKIDHPACKGSKKLCSAFMTKLPCPECGGSGEVVDKVRVREPAIIGIPTIPCPHGCQKPETKNVEEYWILERNKLDKCPESRPYVWCLDALDEIAALRAELRGPKGKPEQSGEFDVGEFRKLLDVRVDERFLCSNFNRVYHRAQEAADCIEQLREKLYFAEQRIKRDKATIEQLQAEIEEWRNKEGSVCPEDVGFVEYITVLNSKIKALTQKVAELENIKCAECGNKIGEGIECWCLTCAKHNGVVK